MMRPASIITMDFELHIEMRHRLIEQKQARAAGQRRLRHALSLT
jgi:hypothetical protein